MNPCNKNTERDKYVSVSLPVAGLRAIVQLLQIEVEAWEYTVRSRQTGMPEEGLLTRDTKTTKNAQKMAAFNRSLIRQIERALKYDRKCSSGRENESSHCASWIDSQGCDAETLVELTREMSEILSNEAFELDDSRCFYRLCIDMTRHFQKLHSDKDWDQVDFLSAIIRYAARVKKKLLSYPDWINSDYKWMYGTECITDLLSKKCQSEKG